MNAYAMPMSSISDDNASCGGKVGMSSTLRVASLLQFPGLPGLRRGMRTVGQWRIFVDR